MKKSSVQIINCSHCGERIMPAVNAHPLCPWCEHMMLEAKEIQMLRQKRRDAKVLPLILN